MKIVVLAGGTSTEREISIVSGTGICKALRERGHQAILVDVYCGNENLDPVTAFDGEYDVDAAAAYMRSFDSKIKEMQASGKEFFGPKVLELCKAADVVFLGLHGKNGEDGKVQAAFDLLGIIYTGSGYLGSAIAMDKGLSKKLFLESGVPTCLLYTSNDRRRGGTASVPSGENQKQSDHVKKNSRSVLNGNAVLFFS